MTIVAKGFLDTPLANQIRDTSVVVTNQGMRGKMNGKALPYWHLELALCLQ